MKTIYENESIDESSDILDELLNNFSCHCKEEAFDILEKNIQDIRNVNHGVYFNDYQKLINRLHNCNLLYNKSICFDLTFYEDTTIDQKEFVLNVKRLIGEYFNYHEQFPTQYEILIKLSGEIYNCIKSGLKRKFFLLKIP
jgi:hypothetical protein